MSSNHPLITAAVCHVELKGPSSKPVTNQEPIKRMEKCGSLGVGFFLFQELLLVK